MSGAASVARAPGEGRQIVLLRPSFWATVEATLGYFEQLVGYRDNRIEDAQQLCQ